MSEVQISLPVETPSPTSTSFISEETKRVSVTWTACLPLIFAASVVGKVEHKICGNIASFANPKRTCILLE